MNTPFVKFISQGAIVQEYIVGDKNIVLGFNNPSEYRNNPAHFGETIGRVANRLKDAKITCLNGTEVHLEANDGPNTLHGGRVGWGLKDFSGPKSESVNGKESVVYTYLSPDGDEKFPGAVEVKVAYTAYEDDTEDANVKKAVLEMNYETRLVGDEVDETVVNITNHSFVSPLLLLIPSY
jgi:aldose 1-epimerase